MKLTVKVENQSFEVEVGDIHARPIVATVDSETFEVWPEETTARPATAARTVSARPAPIATEATTARAVLAPLPGTIVAISVKPGAAVAHGQELCVIDAMKMKNVIRASRAGTIATVNVAVNQSVKHHDVLLEFAD